MIAGLVATHGYWFVGLMVGLESMGIPVPGETALVTAALYAGTTHNLDIRLVLLVAAFGAIMGDNAGYWIGRRYGHDFLIRHRRLLRATPDRIMLGQYLFLRHGGKVVFFGRFIAVLRTLSALLAGVNLMPWRRFLVFNALGGVVWTAVFGIGAYAFGEQIEALEGPVAWLGIGVAIAAGLGGIWFARRHEAGLLRRAQEDR
jgi:membrane protein DedA with SNARE-associated domain